MADDNYNAEEQKAKGELFARLYMERGAPAQDNPFFRNRLDAYLQTNHYSDYAKISAYLKQEAGLIVSTSYLEKFHNVYYNFAEFFSKTRIDLVLSAFTLIWRFLRKEYSQLSKTGRIDSAYEMRYPEADAWREFVSRALREENLAYVLDEMCGVHYHIDEEFERNRISALNCLDSPKYAGVRAAFESAHRYLDTTPPDTKAAVRAAFEAFEISARLICPASKNLNKWMVENVLAPAVLKAASDATEIDAINKLFEGIAIQVDGLHLYRHGQASTEPVAPSLTLAVYVVSTVAAAIRWLVAVDLSNQP